MPPNAASFLFASPPTLIVEPSEAPGESTSTCFVLSGLAMLMEWSSCCATDGMLLASSSSRDSDRFSKDPWPWGVLGGVPNSSFRSRKKSAWNGDSCV